MNSLSERIMRVMPMDYAVQKVKIRNNMTADRLGIDWVVRRPTALPESKRELNFLKLKGAQIDVADLLREPMRVRTLIVHKSVTISAEDLDLVRRAWNVETVFDFRNKSKKKEMKAALKDAKEPKSGDVNRDDFNKAVINLGSSQDKKVKVACGQERLSEVVSLLLSKTRPMEAVTSVKIVKINFQETPAAFEGILGLISQGVKVVLKKCPMTPEQEARKSAAEAAAAALVPQAS